MFCAPQFVPQFFEPLTLYRSGLGQDVVSQLDFDADWIFAETLETHSWKRMHFKVLLLHMSTIVRPIQSVVSFPAFGLTVSASALAGSVLNCLSEGRKSI
jgi:hypothetical protein